MIKFSDPGTVGFTTSSGIQLGGLDLLRKLYYNGIMKVKEEIELLLRLQEQDLKLQELKEGIAYLNNKQEELKDEIKRSEKDLKEHQVKLSEMRRESRRRNDEVDMLDDRIRKYKRQLDEGIISFKEMEALREQISHLQAKVEELEDKALELMMEIEAEEKKIKEEESFFVKLKDEYEKELEILATKIEEEKTKVAKCEKKREKIKQNISSHLLNRYERLKLDYESPVVAIKVGTCAGCNLKLSETTLERAREGVELAVCENCSRILYFERQ